MSISTRDTIYIRRYSLHVCLHYCLLALESCTDVSVDILTSVKIRFRKYIFKILTSPTLKMETIFFALSHIVSLILRYNEK